MTDHARFAPSAAERWLNCSASVDAAARFPDPPGEPAMEGTAAHFLLERCLVDGGEPKDHVGKAIIVREQGIERRFVVSFDMARDVTLGTDYIRTVAKEPGWTGVEHRIGFSLLAPGTFGTVDLWHISQPRTTEGSVLTIVDFKYGHNDVSAVENSQLGMYAIGVHSNWAVTNITVVKLVIVQPRSIAPVPRIKEWDTDNAWLDRLFVRLQDAMTEANRAPRFVAGPWCKYCPALGGCPATSGSLAQVAPLLEQSDMSPADAKHILDRKDQLEQIVKKAERVMLEALLKGTKVPGWSLKTGVKHRQWRDADLVRQALSERIGPQALVAPTPAQVEKLGKEGKAIAAEMAFTPEGDPVAAREGDKRAPYIPRTAQQMFGG